MKLRYSTPIDLTEALHAGAAGAREQLWSLLREPVDLLLRELARRQWLPLGDRLTTHALHVIETYLRTRRPEEFRSTTWAAFRNAALLHLGRIVSQPFGNNGTPKQPHGPTPLPPSDLYHLETFYRPYDERGVFRFGGDWFGGLHDADGALWVIVADITGHGYHAYLLATALPAAWQQCWRTTANREPVALLAAMHDLLVDCLPDGIYAECTLVRLKPTGETTVLPAGGTRMLIRRRGQPRPELLKLRGTWLGLMCPTVEDQRQWHLHEGDELLLGTDGVFDHLADHAGPEYVRHLENEAASLLYAVQELLGKALAAGPQCDDLTLVLLRRRHADDGKPEAGVLPFDPHGRRDVSV